ncbi:GNAT family N-acetyltransferase [Lactiplantibacillus modestisalitolerans]|uniref:GNAT family N-acetyltransferase n=1 Tax=Lactiplantibacillus modestisalitolerans TaxID=1457219 RepID=A0ABV5WWE0_9LACO|nr:GNAT family N-acetyltransferase [Lactiplantibacillus modestisalitolerans]
MQTETRKLTVNDAQLLRQISIETFQDTFGAQNTAANMQAYLSEAYDLGKLTAELANPESWFYFVFVAGHDEPAGYLKLNVGAAQSEAMGPHALEVERIYIRSAYKHRGLGSAFIQQALKFADDAHKKKIWLGVWEHNEPAKAFYHKWGFEPFSAHSFVMGDDPQTDILMQRSI